MTIIYGSISLTGNPVAADPKQTLQLFETEKLQVAKPALLVALKAMV